MTVENPLEEGMFMISPQGPPNTAAELSLSLMSWVICIWMPKHATGSAIPQLPVWEGLPVKMEDSTQTALLPGVIMCCLRQLCPTDVHTVLQEAQDRCEPEGRCSDGLPLRHHIDGATEAQRRSVNR